MDIRGINPLYTEQPEVFWALFDAAAPSVEMLMREFPEMTQEDAEAAFALWEGIPQSPKTEKQGTAK